MDLLRGRGAAYSAPRHGRAFEVRTRRHRSSAEAHTRDASDTDQRYGPGCKPHLRTAGPLDLNRDAGLRLWPFAGTSKGHHDHRIHR